MMEALSLSAAACTAFGSEVDRNALSSLLKGYSVPAEFNLHEVVSVQVIRRLKGKVRTDAHGQWADHWVADIEVVMQVAGWDTPNDAVVGIIGRVLWHRRFERTAL
jgi:hypothetical protein